MSFRVRAQGSDELSARQARKRFHMGESISCADYLAE